MASPGARSSQGFGLGNRCTGIGWRVFVFYPADDISYRAVTHDWYDVKLGWGGIVLQPHQML